MLFNQQTSALYRVQKSTLPLAHLKGHTSWNPYITHLNIVATQNGWDVQAKEIDLMTNHYGPALELFTTFRDTSIVVYGTLKSALSI